MGRQANLESMMPYLQAQALRGLVQQKVMEELADRKGVVVTDDEVLVQLTDELKRIPAFVGPGGQLKPRQDIEDLLRQSGWTLAMMERSARNQLLFGKLRSQSALLMPVDAAWVELEHRVKSEKVAFDYVTLEPEIGKVADPGDAPLEAFLKAGGARFQTAPRRVLQVAALTPATMGEVVKVTDDELKKLYEANTSRFRELKASHILFKADSEAGFKEAETKAEALRAKLVAGQDFAVNC